ncbi:5-formyltetrahydrofolate cyclo-ligase [Acidimangrovimonas pyrenivorans]|uniref:5-formyltetrahydrofolate cyclo-ligase n=1 Tax=Acidimangrovimonas pyrenivorans TaxID=2030798 RepID=A0ABV7ALH5_9RHOB
MADIADLSAAKAAARKAAFARRKAAFAAGQGAATEHLSALLAPHAGKVLAGYMPMRTEIDPLPAMAAHAGPVCVPVIIGPGQPLRFRRWTPEATMVAGAFGALIPEQGDWLEPEVLIVPLVAYDRRGYRLGYGGGFYDRTLEGLRARHEVLAIGFAFAAQAAEELPLEPTDQPLDMIVTEDGAVTLAR